jgi:hypothetical protein
LILFVLLGPLWPIFRQCNSAKRTYCRWRFRVLKRASFWAIFRQCNRARSEVKKRDFSLFSRQYRVVHISCRPCENSDAKPGNPICAQFSRVLSDQKSADRKNSL